MSNEAVVTGVAGFLGSNLAEHLMEEGYEITGIDNFHSSYSEEIKRDNLNQVRRKSENLDREFDFIEGSVLKKSDLDRLPNEPDLVFHLAAIAGTRASIEEPSKYMNVNIQGTSKLIESFESIGKIVFISSSSIYGDLNVNELPTKENSELSPITPYALSKINAEKIVKLYSDIYDYKYSIVRPFTVYGPRQKPDQAVISFLRRIASGEPISVYGNGSQTRDFTYVKDAVRGILEAAESGNGVYNIARGERRSVNELIEIIENQVDITVDIEYSDRHSGDVSHTHADVSKAKEELDYEPKIDLEEGIERTVEWFDNSFYSSKSNMKIRKSR